ncbi:hypothetical protein [Actinoplanes sp. NPDC049118]|uniref:hypothetical protein n=1 Tax=Actinoplanes sp. NPDC049118 TaxID=3155769 RepID=UPI0033F172C9
MSTRSVKRSVAILLLASGIATVGAASPAAASVNDPVLHAIDQSPITASCTYSANVHWERASRMLTGLVNTSSAWLIT